MFLYLVYQNVIEFTDLVMDTLKQTLLEYLKSANPVLLSDRCPSGANTSSKPKTYFTPGRIDKWEDFDYGSLRSIYDGALHRVLKRSFPCQDFSIIPQVPFREVSDENSFEALVTKWNQSVICEALSVAQGCLYKLPTTKTISMAKGGQGTFSGSAKYRPDWAGIQSRPQQPNSARQDGRSKNVLPGDTKVSTKWSSHDIVSGPVQSEYTTKDWLRPLTQVYTYCVKANARYGYIITDKELVAIRVRPNVDTDDQPTNDSQDSWKDVALSQEDPQKAQSSFQEAISLPKYDESNGSMPSSPTLAQMCDDGRLEYKAISWSNAKTRDPRRRNDLTVNLALWWLHIMASVSSNIQEQYPPLKEVAQPTCFGEEFSSFALAETSENPRPNLPIRSRKRSCSVLSDEDNLSEGSSNSPTADCEKSTRGMKRFKTENDGSQNRRQTRSMVHSQT